MDEANIAHEGTLAALRQKHNSSMAELGNQIDGINKNKARIINSLTSPINQLSISGEV